MEYNEFVKLLPTELNNDIVLHAMFAMTKFDFTKILKLMKSRTSFGADSYGYMLPESSEPEDEDYFEDGVELFFGDTHEWISDSQFNDYLTAVCRYYGERNPDNKLLVECILQEILKR